MELFLDGNKLQANSFSKKVSFWDTLIYIDEQMNICEILKYTDSHSDSQITQEGISKPGYRILMKNRSNTDSANSVSRTETKEVAPLRRQSVTVPHKTVISSQFKLHI